ncbi:MAG: SDR family NAD(P)-dependent oxidoreductase, partial [Gammaproteobacteria bacterium]
MEPNAPPDWVLIATGWLHDGNHQPEKRLADLDPAHLARSYQLNAVGPMMLVQALESALPRRHAVRYGLLSARVGSISDNRMGGWHSYRASKAALNMLIRNCAIEWDRARLPRIIVGLQPGTTDTALSAPFQRHLPAGQLQTPEFTAKALIRVMRNLAPEDSGGLFDFEGLPFAP